MTESPDPDRSALTRAVTQVLSALARLLLRHGLALPAFIEIAKRAYVDAVLREFAIPGRKPSASRIALLSGLTRKEVQRLLAISADRDADADAMAAPGNRAARVVAGWIQDREFAGPDGQPGCLPFDGAGGSFSELVRRYSGDMPVRAVLDELLNVGSVRREPDGRLSLQVRAYLPRTVNPAAMGILGADVSWLIEAIDHNLQGRQPARFQRKVVYDNLPAEALPEFRAISARHAQELTERLGEWLARHDRDVNPALEGSGRFRAGIGIFSFEHDIGASADGERK